jgi:hypothetical protein
MTPVELVAALSHAYNYRIPPETVAIYVEMIDRRTSDPQARAVAVQDLIATEPRFPSVATILTAYRAAKDRKPPQHAIEAPAISEHERAENARRAAELRDRIRLRSWPAA